MKVTIHITYTKTTTTVREGKGGGQIDMAVSHFFKCLQV